MGTTGSWKCSVCGYTHEGNEPPEECPRCGADGSRFIRLQEEKLNLLHDVIDTFVLHPVAAHFPNGLLPTAVLFLLFAFVSGNRFFEHTVYHLLIVVLCVLPFTMAAGIYDWRTKYHGVKAKIFYKKIGLASLLLLTGLAAGMVRWNHPDVMTQGGGLTWVYAGMLLAMLPIIGLLGHYGAKLVYHWEKKDL